MSRIILIPILILFIGNVVSQIQPIDVDPVMKKEQPDFEDDTGAQAISISASVALPQNNNNVGPIDTFMKNYLPGADIGFTHGFIASLCVIVVSELGDKTFFIAAIMAMNHPRMTVFAGAMAALAAMHVMSAMFGFVIQVIPRAYTFYASSALFAIFGIKMLREGLKMSADEGKEEFEEVQTDLRRREDSLIKEPLEEGGAGKKGLRRNKILSIVSRIFVQSFTMTFLAEWGDRSQIATVILAAREDVVGVIVGGVLGHFLCTGLAVIGGRMIATRISVRTVTIIGGVVFILFALSALVIEP